MSQYYIKATLDGVEELFALDATVQITQNTAGVISSFPLESGVEVSDNYVNKNNTISFSGVIADTKSQAREINLDQNKTTLDFASKLQKVKSEGTPFNVHSGLLVLEDCVFETLTFSQDVRSGSVIGGRSSFRVSFTAKQIRFAERAQKVTVRDEALDNKTQSNIIKSGNVQEVSEEKTRLVKIGGTIYTRDEAERLVERSPELADKIVPYDPVDKTFSVSITRASDQTGS